MGPVSRWAVNQPKRAVAAWLAMAVAIVALASTFGGALNNSFSLPDTESKTANELLASIRARVTRSRPLRR